MDTETLDVPAALLMAAKMWDSEQDDTLVCLDVHQETHDVRTFTFGSPQGKHFAFEAGQYFVFDVELEDGIESRCYSISSSPHRGSNFSITVKRVKGGRVSNWLHDRLVPGAVLKAKGPLGSFVRSLTRGQKLLLLSGGSGMTPVMSILRDLADRRLPADVVFMHATRTPEDIIFRHELSWLAAGLKGARLHILPESVMGEPSWPGLTGRISQAYMQLAVPDIAERTVMCCGPAPFMATAREITSALGVPPSNYFEESFDATVIDEPALFPQATVASIFQVRFAKQAKTIEVSSEQTVLSCAKKAAVRIPSSCANGVCGTCKSRLVSGSVEMNHNGGIRQREIDAGMFLPCCAKPLSDLVVDR
jgi:glycine betaine catabolism B